MCRILALRSDQPQPLYHSLLSGDNSFALQSLEHPDGWGLAYYVDDAPQVVRSVVPAICDELFEEISFDVSARAILGHIRRASFGAVTEVNCHPFRRGPWTFAHNGHVGNYSDIRERLLDLLAPDVRENIEGTTDSEVYFGLLMTNLGPLAEDEGASARYVCGALTKTVLAIRELATTYGRADDPSWLSCLLTNGDLMIGMSAGKPLSVRRSYGSNAGRQVVFSSEAITARGLPRSGNSWRELEFGELCVVDSSLNLEIRGL